MSIRTTRRDVMSSFLTMRIGYCNAQNLLSRSIVTAHTEGTLGWNADVYVIQIGGAQAIAIVTGYRPFGEIDPEYELVKHYDRAAEAIKSNYALSYEEQTEQINALRDQFISVAHAAYLRKLHPDHFTD